MVFGGAELGAATEAAARLEGVDTMGAAPAATGAAAGADAALEGVLVWADLVAMDASLCLRKTSSLASQEAAERDVPLLRMHTHSGQRSPPKEK